MGNNRCSDCNVQFMWAGNHDFKICPECKAVLWHTDWSGAERRTLAATATENAKRERERQARADEKAKEIIAQTQVKEC